MSSYLYLIRCNDFFKIGIAGHIESRLAALQTGNPYELVVESCYQFDNPAPVEQSLHNKFRNKQAMREWFRLEAEDLEQFEQICQLLDGQRHTMPVTISEQDTEEAEALTRIISEESTGYDPADFEQMIAAGWRVEVTNRGKYWLWRRGSGSHRESRYGGYFEHLPPEQQTAYERNKASANGIPAGLA